MGPRGARVMWTHLAEFALHICLHPCACSRRGEGWTRGRRRASWRTCSDALALDLGYGMATTRDTKITGLILHGPCIRTISHAILVLAARDFACCRSFIETADELGNPRVDVLFTLADLHHNNVLRSSTILSPISFVPTSPPRSAVLNSKPPAFFASRAFLTAVSTSSACFSRPRE